MSQLNPPGGSDLRELVMSCTAVKQIFSAHDPWLQKYVSELSGKVLYANLTYPVAAAEVALGNTGLDCVLTDERGNQVVTIGTYVGNRLNTQDILNVNRDPNMCFLAIERSEGFSRFTGIGPAYVDWPMEEHTYVERSDYIPWPDQTEETITLRSPWPSQDSETVVPKPKLVLSAPDYEKEAADRLKKLKRDLDEE